MVVFRSSWDSEGRVEVSCVRIVAKVEGEGKDVSLVSDFNALREVEEV